VQVEGSDARMPQKFEKPYCYLASAKVSRLQKLQYIQRVLESGQTLTVIPHIQNYMNEELELQQSGKDPAWSNEEKNILLGLKANEKIKKDFQQLLNLPGDMYLKLRVDILNLMKSLLQITEDEFKEKIVSILDLNLSQPMTLEKKDLICSLGIESDFVYEQIPQARWSDQYFMNTVGCLKPKNPKIHQVLVEAMLKDANRNVRQSAVWAFGKIKPSDPQIHQVLVEVLLNDTDSWVHWNAAQALIVIKPTDPKILQYLIDNETKAQDPKLVQKVIDQLRAR
ncbi:MAG: HEAT repeat domain-containing protein, partial [Pseudobdellovibrionaceae bacterium]